MANLNATHLSGLAGKIIRRSSHPAEPQTGEIYIDSSSDIFFIYDGSNWYGTALSTTTSTSTSTTSTSTSTTSTSTSTSSSSSSSTTTSISTSTTTTL